MAPEDGSAWLCAVTITLYGLSIRLGERYRPVELIVPALAPAGALGSRATLYVTELLAEVVVALNCRSVSAGMGCL
jgi:hypothetical protein